ncbi:MAG TPA: type I 3-dehydroquinate dehydratase [Terriglobia bacterium]|nr:type I 3-dehydroquinate dehydratase [Terriglobia bacterium]
MGSGGLCVSLTPESLDDVFSPDVSGADFVEIRLDYLKDPKQAENTRWDRFPVPVIATCRGIERGGLFQGSLDDEYRILDTAVRNGAKFVDIDYQHTRAFGSAQVIASHHNFDCTPPNLESLIEEACATSAQIAKVATHVNRWSDNRRIFEALAKPWPKPVIIVGMGDMGQITRIAGPSRGSFLSYAAANRQSGPGQVRLAEMLNDYKFRRVKKSTKLIGVLGMPVGHSQSHILHNRAFEASKLDFAYMKFPADDVADFLENARQCGIAGFSVTIPHKMSVLPLLNKVAPEASAIGAVNTVSDTPKGWAGDNTDIYGVRVALKVAGFDPAGKTVVILGKGGGAKAVAAAVEGAKEIIVLSRGEIEDSNERECDLLVNATPVGMFPNIDESPTDGTIRAGAVFDLVYNPPVTKFLQNAASQGKTIIPGTTMLAAQASRQFEIWTGKSAPSDSYRSDWSTS